MSAQRTLVLVKPDGVGKRLIGKVLERFENAGLKVVGLKMLRLDEARAQGFYKEHVGKPFFPGLLHFMTSGPIVALVLEGPDAVQHARVLMGATNSKEAAAGTLRHDFGTDNRKNLVHGSDSPASAEREIAYFFPANEQFSYGDKDWMQDAPSAAMKG